MAKWGFIGLGSQGAPMARRMIETGHEVALWARRSQTLDPFVGSGATFTDSIAHLAREVEHCGVCVVDDAGVKQVCEQLISAMAPGGRIAIHSTVNPQLCQSLAVQAAERRLLLVDAPVSGGGEGAAAGTLTVMVGGTDEAVAAVRPVLESFAGVILHLGNVGSGQSAKLINNNLMAANLAVAHHALHAADTLGIDRDELVRMIAVSSGRSFGFDVRARMPAPAAFKHGAQLLAKDVGLLGDVLGDDPGYARLRDMANSFLALALAE